MFQLHTRQRLMMMLLLWRLLLTDGRGDTLLFPSHGVAFCVAAFLVAALLPELAGGGGREQISGRSLWEAHRRRQTRLPRLPKAQPGGGSGNVVTEYHHLPGAR